MRLRTSKLWPYDTEMYKSQISNKVIMIMDITLIDGVYSTQYLFKNIMELEFYQRKFICQIYEDNKTFLELR